MTRFLCLRLDIHRTIFLGAWVITPVIYGEIRGAGDWSRFTAIFLLQFAAGLGKVSGWGNLLFLGLVAQWGIDNSYVRIVVGSMSVSYLPPILAVGLAGALYRFRMGGHPMSGLPLGNKWLALILLLASATYGILYVIASVHYGQVETRFMDFIRIGVLVVLLHLILSRMGHSRIGARMAKP